MKEIKFRGKDAHTGEWVYGYYCEHIKRQICPIGDELSNEDIQHYIILSGFADWNMYRPLLVIDVIPETVGQYTGFKDKNGKEIYEGDIVRCWGGEFCQGYYEYNRTKVVNDLIADGFMMGEYDNLEVLGNIYDNPELALER